MPLRRRTCDSASDFSTERVPTRTGCPFFHSVSISSMVALIFSRSERKMRSVLFQNAERQNASSLGLLYGVTELVGGQLLPVRREFL